MLPGTLLIRRTSQFHNLRHLETDLVLDDFEHRDVACAKIAGLGNQRPADGARAGSKLADAA